MSQGLKKNVDNQLIKKRRRKRGIKKAIFTIIFLTTVLIVVCLKAPFFNIKGFNVVGNKIISKENIINLSGVQVGNNIFYINSRAIKETIKTNPYIKDVKIKRKLPDVVIFEVKERNAYFYTQFKDNYFIIDKDTRLLEKRNNIKNMNLVRLEGIEVSNVKIGDVIYKEEDRHRILINEFSKLIESNTSDINITAIDFKDMLDLKVYHNNMLIKLGTGNDIKDKLNKAFNIIASKKEFSKYKGYIDVSFDGNPVIYIEQK